MLLGVVTALTLLSPMSVQAIDIDLVPDDTEDALCEQMSDDTGGILSCGEDYYEITSFTEYEGSFDAPDAAGYDPGLTQATSAREFILNVTNFALSFLGIVAVVIIIYGGFLYVTAGGKDEQTEKGKKSVMYAVIGILVVLSSYAIVNTLISEAPGGGEDRGGGGVYSAGDTITGEELDATNINYVADELQDVAAEFVDVFTTYSNVNSYLDYAVLQQMPDLETVSSIFDKILDDQAYEDDSVHEFEVHAETMNEVAREIKGLVDRYSDAYEAADILEKYTQDIVDGIDDFYQYNNAVSSINLIPKAHAYYDSGELLMYFTTLPVYLGNVAIAAQNDYNEHVEDYVTRLQDVQKVFSVFAEDTGAVLFDINWALEMTTIPTMESASQSDADEFVANSVLRDVVEALGEIYALVADLEFTDAVITANIKEVNAPAIVTFDGLKSYDPSDLTIGDTQYNWDLDGDGNYGESITGCEETSEASVSCTYTETGTYRVGLIVTSNSPNFDIAPGQSYISITVLPPVSQIYMTATNNAGDVTLLADYANNFIDDYINYTLQQGSAGIRIDMDGTVDGNGDPTVYHTIDCGNGETYSGNAPLNEVCTYTEEKTYTLIAEVTDMIGNVDRYIGRIEIGSPAAAIKASDYSGNVGDKISFDGSASTTDKGTIVNQSWTAMRDGSVFEVGEGSEVDYEFDEPGVYTVKLEVTDSSDERDIDEVEIIIDSQPPVATFEYEIPDPTQPAIVHFDASDSYDPDPLDTISFLWYFENEGYEYLEGTDERSAKPIVKFDSVGDKDVTLQVSDQYVNEDLKKTTELTQTIEIESVLDIDLDLPNGIAHQLDEEGGGIEVTFNAISEHAVAFELHYGDEEYDVTENAIGDTATFTHTYRDAGTYLTELTVYDEEDNENTFSKKVYIGESDAPIAVISVDKDGNEVGQLEIEGSINTVFTFDAGDSMNTDGSSRNLSYSWNFGDQTVSTEKKATHTYDETGIFDITLTVYDENDTTKYAEDSIEITITEEPPVIKSLMAVVKSDTNVTPVTIYLEADAKDPDGYITNYYWYYYDITNSTEQLGTQITTDNNVEMVIPTRGTTGEKKTYAFVVEVTDTGNNKVSSEDVIDAPTVEVENGENEAPVVKDITASDTLIMLGDSFTVASDVYDPDGDDMTYVWDLEGDGFSDNDETTLGTITVTPEEAGCMDIRLKAIDENEQATVSANSIKICVESIASPPEAAFVYTVDSLTAMFENNSTVDVENGADFYAYQWDFDLDEDSDGNGDSEDDIDSTEENPSFTYTSDGSYEVKLTVYDNAGGVDDVEHTIMVADTEPPTAAFTYDINGLEVDFESNSTTDNEEILIVSYKWDFDTTVDSDGDGEADNDADSIAQEPDYTYPEYGTYTVSLTVMDSMNKEDSVTRAVEVEEAELIGYMTSDPEASPADSKIHILGTSGTIDVSYSTSRETGDGITCWLDKNVYYDTDGDGVKNNDHDYEEENCMTGSFSGIYYEESWGLVVIMFVVEDVNGDSYEVTKEIVFDEEELSMASTNIFPVSGSQGLVLMIVAISFALLGASIYTVRRIN